MRCRDYVYIILMIFFIILAYLFFDRGFNVKTKELVKYKESSDIVYLVYLNKNNEYDDAYLKMGGRYIASLVDDIKFDFNYKSLFNNEVSGYYSYMATLTLHAYMDSAKEAIWEKDYTVLDNKVEVINQGGVKDIDILDRVVVDYDKYRQELKNFSKKYGIDLAGYLELKIIIKENLNFKGIEKIVNDEKMISANIPLSYDTFRITINNDNNKIGNYYNFNNRTKVNYLFIIIAAFMLSLGISFMALVIREMYKATDYKVKYRRELKKILKENDEIIVRIKRFYNKKKYNLIYVDSFKELMDVYDKVKAPISYRELKKGEEAMFIIIDADNAWIYRMVAHRK